jgi:hypothetical protein
MIAREQAELAAYAQLGEFLEERALGRLQAGRAEQRRHEHGEAPARNPAAEIGHLGRDARHFVDDDDGRAAPFPVDAVRELAVAEVEAGEILQRVHGQPPPFFPPKE